MVLVWASIPHTRLRAHARRFGSRRRCTRNLRSACGRGPLSPAPPHGAQAHFLRAPPTLRRRLGLRLGLRLGWHWGELTDCAGLIVCVVCARSLEPTDNYAWLPTVATIAPQRSADDERTTNANAAMGLVALSAADCVASAAPILGVNM